MAPSSLSAYPLVTQPFIHTSLKVEWIIYLNDCPIWNNELLIWFSHTLIHRDILSVPVLFPTCPLLNIKTILSNLEQEQRKVMSCFPGAWLCHFLQNSVWEGAAHLHSTSLLSCRRDLCAGLPKRLTELCQVQEGGHLPGWCGSVAESGPMNQDWSWFDSHSGQGRLDPQEGTHRKQPISDSHNWCFYFPLPLRNQ